MTLEHGTGGGNDSEDSEIPQLIQNRDTEVADWFFLRGLPWRRPPTWQDAFAAGLAKGQDAPKGGLL